MGVRTRLWTTLAAAGLMALPLSTAAQSTTSSAQSGQSGTTATQSGQQSTQTGGQASSSSKSPTYYLDQARTDLDSLSSSVKNSDAGKDLERHFNQLRSTYTRDAGTASESAAMGGTSGTAGSASGSTSAAPPSQSSDSGRGDTWRTHYRQIEQVLDNLDVPRSSAWMPSPAGSSETGGTEGTSGSGSSATSGTTGTGSSSASGRSGATSLDAGDIAQLKQFREDIEMFYQSISSSGGSSRKQ